VLIAAVAIVHVFISHFAVGGGLFLVLAERRARRENDEALLGYVRCHSRFFAVLLVAALALTGGMLVALARGRLAATRPAGGAGASRPQ
jgi:hypothetical protein